MLNKIKVNKKQVLWGVMFTAFLGFMAIMVFKIGYVMGNEEGRHEVVDATNEYLNQYNTYLVEKETASDGRNYQLGSGRGFIKLPTIRANKYFLYDYEDGKLVFEYGNIKP